MLRLARGTLAFAAVLAWMALAGFPLLYLWYLPATWLRPSRRRVHVSRYMKIISWGILRFLETGGARFRRRGRIPTDGPLLILMNHQSLLDVPTVNLMTEPTVPAFVTRRRYARFVPLVSACVRLLDCPVVDPRRDARGAAEALRRAAPRQDAGLLIFPEGHRTRDGQVQAFRPAGAVAVLSARRMPVYLVVTDGFWKSRRLVDFILNVPRLRGETEVLGPFEPPAEDAALSDFVRGLRQTLVAHLERMRERVSDAA